MSPWNLPTHYTALQQSKSRSPCISSKVLPEFNLLFFLNLPLLLFHLRPPLSLNPFFPLLCYFCSPPSWLVCRLLFSFCPLWPFLPPLSLLKMTSISNRTYAATPWTHVRTMRSRWMSLTHTCASSHMFVVMSLWGPPIKSYGPNYNNPNPTITLTISSGFHGFF